MGRSCASVVACCVPAPVFRATEHALDAIAVLIGPLVILDRFAARFPIGMGRHIPVANRTNATD